jgi:antitoxin component YwqK of YwqJK toxin-antitoxin module
MGIRIGCFIFLIFIGFCTPAIAQDPDNKVLYVDKNYNITDRKRDAIYRVVVAEDGDTAHFMSYSIRPEALVEKGKYRITPGADFRTAYLQRYWPNGRWRSFGRTKDLLPDGTWVYFDESGLLYSKVNYTNGQLSGEAVRYYTTGKSRYYTYVNNKRNGPSRLMTNDGKMQELNNYENDSLHGACYAYFQTGSIKRKTVYNNGLKVTDTLYWENGKPFSCEKYNEFGNLHGRAMMFNVNGKMSRYDEYEDGVLTQNLCLHPLSDENFDGEDCPVRLKEAQFPGGLGNFLDFVSINQDYPDAALDWKQGGVVIVEFTVDTDGNIAEVTPENIIPLGYGLETECLRLLGQIKKFEPRKLSGRPFPARIRLPFLFVVQQ